MLLGPWCPEACFYYSVLVVCRCCFSADWFFPLVFLSLSASRFCGGLLFGFGFLLVSWRVTFFPLLSDGLVDSFWAHFGVQVVLR